MIHVQFLIVKETEQTMRGIFHYFLSFFIPFIGSSIMQREHFNTLSLNNSLQLVPL